MKLLNSNPAKNPRPSGPDLGAQVLSMPAGDGEDDDDDFQNPSQSVALSQSLILSSLKSSRFQPLKLSNGCRSRKRLKPCAAFGKENGSVAKKQSSVSRVSSDVHAKIPVITTRKDFYNKTSPVSSGNRDIAIGCFEEDEIEDQKSNLSAPDALNLGEYWPYFEKIYGKGSQHLVPVEANLFESVVSVPSNFDPDCSDVCTNNVELGKKLRSSCDLERVVAMREIEYTDECNVYDETKPGEARLASTELRLPEYWPERQTEIEILNHSADQSMFEGKVEISSEARLLEVKEKPIPSEQREYSSEIDDCIELNLIRKLQEPKVLGKGPIGGMQSLSARGCEMEIVLLTDKKQDKNSRSIEAKLLDPSERMVSCNIRDDCVEANGFEEFQPGTQLKMLMDLCCEMDDQGCSGSEMTSFEHNNLGTKLTGLEMNLLVECPLCQADITKLSEEMRQIHTNECLDKDDTTEESVPIDQPKPNPCQQIVDTNPVLEWLRALDLCRYEDVFKREEIDWDTLQWLTEEDLISIGVVALGPRKKIVFSLNELRKGNSLAPDGESDSSNVATNEKKKLSLKGNKLITEYFHGPLAYKVRANIPVKLFNNSEKASKDPIQKKVGNRRYANRGKLSEIPPWCCISGTPFRVDAFRHLRGDCSHWFLTHFHMDHYQGLTKNFCYGKIYCSKITAHLVNMKIGVPWDRIQILPINEKICIAGVNLTCLDANHCPGSIIILFEPSNNKTILHTGDFRFSPEMAGSSLLQSSNIHTLILDTTYCNPQYDFPKQEEVVQFVIDAIQAEAFNPKTLFLIGTYTIGKERLFLEAARILKMKVYVGAGKLHLLKCLDLPDEDMKLLTENEMESHIHVVPMWTIASFKRMKHISNQYMGRYNLIVAFSPTGWTFGKGKKKTPGRRWQQGTVIRYEVPYSEHCSFTELKDFVRFISPENIIPSVNNEGPDTVNSMLSLLLS